jgi:hypothetical protein
MTMNLIQIQDKLKSLPNDPRVMQLLTGYANGQNPQVPPYLALGELNRRKGEMERAQMEKAGQPPGGTVKDQIEQQTGVMALQQGRQQQAMQQMAMQAAAGGGPAPRGTPQPQVQAAAGGLASLAPKGYRSGGIIAFNKGDLVEASNPQREEYERLMREAEEERKKGPPVREDYFARQARLIKENPEMLGALAKPIGQDAIARLDQLQEARRAELAKQKEELAASKPGILQLLGQAAMGTRGQQGKSALASILGGYSDLSSGAQAKQLQQEQALRMKELDLQQAKADVLSKVEEAQRAYAAGNMGKAEAYMKEGEEIAAKHNTSVSALLGKQVGAASQQLESKDRLDNARRESERRSEEARLDRESRERTERSRRADRPFNAIETQFNLLRTGNKEEDAKLLQRLTREAAVDKKPGLDMDLVKKFESLPGVEADQRMLSAYRAQKNPKPEILTKIQQIEDRLTLKAVRNGIDPAKIGISGAAPVESPGAPPPGAVREVKK